MASFVFGILKERFTDYWWPQPTAQASDPGPSNEEIEAKLSRRAAPFDLLKSQKLWDDFSEDAIGEEGGNFHLRALDRKTLIKGDALDIGSGTGENTYYLLSKGWKVTALDISAKFLEILRERTGENPNLETVHSPLEDFEFSKEVDIIVAIDVLGFCSPSKIKQVWTKMHTALNPGGHLLCTFPSFEGFTNWALGRRAIQQFFLDGRFEVCLEQWEDGLLQSHDLLMLLKKI